MLHRIAFLTVSALWPALAGAACSRPIVVPATTLGRLMVVEAGAAVSGIFPDLLRERGDKAGCKFVFPAVPRARAEFMVRSGEADLLLPSVKVAQRDGWGRFVPMVSAEWALVSRAGAAPPASVEQLLERPGIKFNAIRGFNYGAAYLAMLARLDKQGKLEYVNDPLTVARKMQAGRADYTYMSALTFASALEQLDGAAEFRRKVRYTRLAGLPASVTGVYIARTTPAADAAQIEAILVGIRQDGELLNRLRAFFSPEELAGISALPEPRAGE